MRSTQPYGSFYPALDSFNADTPTDYGSAIIEQPKNTGAYVDVFVKDKPPDTPTPANPPALKPPKAATWHCINGSCKSVIDGSGPYSSLSQ